MRKKNKKGQIMNLFLLIIIVQLFYSFAITMMAYSIPVNDEFVTGFSETSENINLEEVSDDIHSSVIDQLDIPVIEIGALVFYSGNILIDLLLNFLYAIPQMMGMLVNGFLMLFNVDSQIFALVELFGVVAVTILYLIGIIQLLINVRSGRTVV